MTFFQTDVDPKTIAQVKFTPSFADPHAEYADEVYYPGIGNDGEVLEPAMTVNGKQVSSQ